VAPPPSAEHSSEADARAREVNECRGLAIARVLRPFQQTFTVADNSSRDLYAGRLPNGRQALAAVNYEGDLHIAIFDERGGLGGVEDRPLERRNLGPQPLPAHLN